MFNLDYLFTYLEVRDYLEDGNIDIADFLEEVECPRVPITVTLNGESRDFDSLDFAAKYIRKKYIMLV